MQSYSRKIVSARYRKLEPFIEGKIVNIKASDSVVCVFPAKQSHMNLDNLRSLPAGGEVKYELTLEEVIWKDEPSSVTDGVSAADHFGFQFGNEDKVKEGRPSCGEVSESHLWSPTFTQIQSSGSPTSKLKSSYGAYNQIRAVTSGSSKEQSDEDDYGEIETCPCEQRTDPNVLKHIRRRISNRESARRSRRRRQAHIADLELEVKMLSVKNVDLYKQLTVAFQQLKDSMTNNRVLKADVEALRAKVKLGEERVTRGSVSCNLNHALESCHLLPNSHSLPPVESVAPEFTTHQPTPCNGNPFEPKNSVINGHIPNA